MAVTPWQRPQIWLPAPLKRRSHGTVPGQFSANLWASHGSGIASTTVKILHKVLPAPVAGLVNLHLMKMLHRGSPKLRRRFLG